MSFWKDVADLKAATKANLDKGLGNRSMAEAMETMAERKAGIGDQDKAAKGTPAPEAATARPDAAVPIGQPSGGVDANPQNPKQKRYGRIAQWISALLFFNFGMLHLLSPQGSRFLGVVIALGAITMMPPIVQRLVSGMPDEGKNPAPGCGLILLLFAMFAGWPEFPKPAAQLSLVTKDKSGATKAAGPDVKEKAVLSTPEEHLKERIQTYWLDEVKKWSPAIMDDAGGFADAMTALDRFALYVIDARDMTLSPEQKRVLSLYLDTLGKKQASLLPAMRRAYAGQMDQNLFRHDVRVSVHGNGNRTLRLTGTMFARNANIEDTQTAMREAASKLRFARIEYRWSRYLEETTFYKLDAPADTAVGTWEGGDFVPIKPDM